MSNIPPDIPPDVDPPGTDWLSILRDRFTSSTQFLTIAAKEWIPSLLDQPTQPPFKHDAQFEDVSGRIARLITIVVIISAILLGSLVVATNNVGLLRTLRTALIVLISCILFALAYKPVAYLCGVRVYSPNNLHHKKLLSLRQIAFATFFTFIPWLPIFAFLRAWFLVTDDPLQFFLLIAHFLCYAYVTFNFSKAIKLVTNCPRYRIWISILSLFVFAGGLIIVSKRV